MAKGYWKYINCEQWKVVRFLHLLLGRLYALLCPLHNKDGQYWPFCKQYNKNTILDYSYLFQYIFLLTFSSIAQYSVLLLSKKVPMPIQYQPSSIVLYYTICTSFPSMVHRCLIKQDPNKPHYIPQTALSFHHSRILKVLNLCYHWGESRTQNIFPYLSIFPHEMSMIVLRL